jgi:signal transduction histidine kinase
MADSSRVSTHLLPGSRGTRLALIAGFGGVLLLMLAAGVDSFRSLREIQAESQHITQAYLDRARSLEKIRYTLYVSSTYTRDYLLDPDTANAQAHLDRLKHLREQMNQAVAAYSQTLTAEEERPFEALRLELAAYWTLLDPIFSWDAGQRKREGYAFLTSQVIPHRQKLIDLADAIGNVNEVILRKRDLRAADLFDRFHTRLVAALGITLAVGLALAALSIRYVLRLEAEARRRYEESIEARRELEQLSARLVAAQEEERRAISRELHDEVGQTLWGLVLDIGNATALAPPGSEELKQRHASMKQLAERCLQSIRNMALLLRPSMLDDFGLVPALHWQAREVSRRTGMEVSISADEAAVDLDEEQRTCVYRVVQEALHNASRHAEARDVQIVVRRDAGRLLVVIRDDGKGFDARRIRGLGLIGMEERVKHLGGSLQVESEPGRGTLLKVELPVVHREAPVAQETA